MNRKNRIQLAAIGILVLLVAGVFLLDSLRHDEAAGPEVSADRPQGKPKVAELVGEEATEQASSELERTVDSSAAVETEEAPSWNVKGVVRTTDGVAVADVHIIAESRSGQVSFASDALGHFEHAVNPSWSSVTLHVADEGWVGLNYGVRTPSTRERLAELHVAPVTRIDGVLLDWEGNPVPSAEITVVIPRDLQLSAAAYERATHKTTTLENGRFVFDPAPLLPGSALYYRGEHGTAQITIGEQRTGIVWQLLAPDPVEELQLLTVKGRVYDSKSQPVERAIVVIGQETARTNVEGIYEIAYPRSGRELPGLVFAGRKHVGGGVLELPLTLLDESLSELSLPDIQLSKVVEVAATLRLDDGTALPNARIKTPTAIAREGIPLPKPLLLEFQLREQPPVTDSDGKFSVELVEGWAYEAMAEVKEFAFIDRCGELVGNGKEQELVIPSDGLRGPLHVHVQTDSGESIPGAKVFAKTIVGQDNGLGLHLNGEVRTTDGAGTCTLERVAGNESSVFVELPNGRTLEYPIEEIAGSLLTAVVYSGVDLLVLIINEAEDGTRVRLLDPASSPVSFEVHSSFGGVWRGDSYPLRSGMNQIKLRTDSNSKTVEIIRPDESTIHQSIPAADSEGKASVQI